MKVQTIYYLITGSRSLLIQMVFTLNAIYYVSEAGLNPLQLVLLGTIMEVSILLMEMPTGLAADYFGRKRSVVIGTCLLGGAHILEGSFPEFWVIAAGSAVWGIGWTFISGAEQAWIADELKNDDLERVFLKGAQYSSLGRFAGIIASVLLAAFLSVQAVIVLAGGLLALLAAIAMKLMPETEFISAVREGMPAISQMIQSIKSGAQIVKGNAVLGGIAAVTLLWGLASEGFDRLWGAHFIEGFNLSEENSVYWFGAFYAGAFLLNAAVLKAVEIYVNGRYAAVLLLLNALLTAAMLFFAFTGAFLAAVLLYWLIESLRHVNEPLMNVMINERLPSQGRATALSMFGQLDALGQVAGGPLVGAAALYTSISGGIAFSAVLILPALFFLWKMRKVA